MKKIIYILFTGFFILTNSCSKKTIDLDPVGQLTADGAFSSGDNAVLSLNGVYRPFADLFGYIQGLSIALEIKSDDAFDAFDRTAPYKIDNETPETPGAAIDTWKYCYVAIQRANFVLSKLDGVPFTEEQIGAGLKESIAGQALFLRALSYYYLVNLYGGVPLFTEYNADPEASQIAQSSIVDVIAQIKADLNAAAENLPLKSQLTGGNGFEIGRATKGAAYALLAEFHLILEEWQEAIAASNMVINSNEYGLRSTDDYAKNFAGLDENGMESIFEIQYGNTLAPDGAVNELMVYYTVFQAPGAVNAYFGGPVTNDDADLPSYKGYGGNGLLQEWEAGDLRKDVVLTTYGIPNPIDPTKPDLWLPLKYYTPSPNIDGSTPINYNVLRYARTLLTKAEALNEVTGGDPEAVSIVNQIRTRAGLAPLASNIATSQTLLREAIWKERRLELCYEGTRYFDLLRTGRYIPIMEGMVNITVPRARVISHPVTGKDWYLWPIPQNELDINPNIIQNPGY
jgi:starch-binding outer membrane protein, SusD/RagB family